MVMCRCMFSSSTTGDLALGVSTYIIKWGKSNKGFEDIHILSRTIIFFKMRGICAEYGFTQPGLTLTVCAQSNRIWHTNTCTQLEQDTVQPSSLL